MKAVVETTEADAIPDDWETVPLGEVGTWLSGGTPSKSKESYWTGEIPWVSPKDVKQARLTDATDRISEEALGDGGKLAPKHAILVVVRGMILAHTFPVARIEREMAFNQDIKAVDTHDFIDSGFLLWWLRNHSSEFLKRATSASHGSKRISTESLFSQPIPVPPREEQEAISEALSDVDALLASIDAAIEKKRNVKTATMQRLLTGEERLPGFEGEWKSISLRELETDGGVTLGRGNVISQEDIERNPGSYPIYSSSVKNRGLFGSYGDYMFDIEMITWSIDGGGHFFYRPSHKFSVTNVCGYMKTDPKRVDCKFLAAQLQLLHGRRSFNYQTKAHPSVIKDIYRVVLPDISEQRAIAEVLSDMDAEIEAWEKRRAKTEAVKTGMMQELLTGKTRLV